MSGRLRLFVAVEVPADVREAVAAALAPLREALPRLRWVAPDRYHLTVAFLGDVAADRVPQVAAALEAGAAGAPAFDLALSGELGTFGRRVLWAGLEPSAALGALAAAVARAVGSVVALPDGDRAFSAHLTLARAGRSPLRREDVAGVEVPALRWRVGRVVLMRSERGYSVEHAVALHDADA